MSVRFRWIALFLSVAVLCVGLVVSTSGATTHAPQQASRTASPVPHGGLNPIAAGLLEHLLISIDDKAGFGHLLEVFGLGGNEQSLAEIKALLEQISQQLRATPAQISALQGDSRQSS